jgi:hypothetical protein
MPAHAVTDPAPARTNVSMRPYLLLLLAAACTHDHDVIIGSAGGNATILKQMPTAPDLDVLFVIDNSASTADKQTVFAQNFPALVNAFDGWPNGRPNLHIGVVDTTVDIGVGGYGPTCPSPDPDDNGLLQNAPRIAGCTPPTDRYLVDVANPDGTRTTNYGSDLADTFSCIAPVGASGCGFEAPLLALQRALDGTRPENAGFLRPDADLAVVILTDEDDCSAADSSIFTLPANQVGGQTDFRCQPLFAYDCDQPITAGSGSATYTNCRPRTGSYLFDADTVAAILAKIKDPSQTSIALIAGDPQTTIQTGELALPAGTQDPALLPSCSATINGSPAVARPGIRLQAFANEYGPRGTFDSVCQSSYSPALSHIASAMQTMMTSPCLDGRVDATDTDAVNPGLQPACVVVDRIAYGTTTEADVTLPACPMLGAISPDPSGPRPCWWAEADESCTSLGSELSMHVERAVAAPAGTVVAATCAKAP